MPPTVRCTRCSVDVMIDKLDAPNRCKDPRCPLKPPSPQPATVKE